MGFDSIWHWLLLLVIVLVIFGTGKLTKMGPDLGNAVRGFKKAMQGDDDEKSDPAEKLKADPPEAAETKTAPKVEPAARGEAAATADKARKTADVDDANEPT